ncbi:MAG: methyltransferase domain-containing protein [Saprospiraceae bacterium]|nr:methyltransferase domain-containing protein [Saprospiraceae bacterium]
MKIEALHEFHDQNFSAEWAKKFEPTPERLALFECMLQRIHSLGTVDIHILELGIGPGYLAEFLLGRLKHSTYEGLDFSAPMLEIAAQRLAQFNGRVTYTQGDLTNDVWIQQISKTPKVIVSTWALHDLFSEDNIAAVYQNVGKLLAGGGLFLNGDFIKPAGSTFDYEGGRLLPNTHLKLLASAGFRTYTCLQEFEKDLLHPTTANNYACFEATI